MQLAVRRRSVLGTLFWLPALALAARGSAQTISGPPTLTAQALREDLRFLVDTVIAVHPRPFAQVSRAAFEAERVRIEGQLRDGMTARDFHLLAAPLLASLQDGHTFLRPPVEHYNVWTANGGLVFPFDVEIRGRRILVSRNHSSAPIAAGTEIRAINGIAADRILTRLLPYSIGEREAFRLSIIQGSFQLLLRLVMGFGDPYEVAYLTNGTAATATVRGVSPDALTAGAPAPAGDPPPAAFEMLPDGIGLLRVSAFDSIEQSQRIYRSAFQALRERGATDLIVDLRGNNGGDSQIGDELLSYLTGRRVSQAARIDVKISSQIHQFYRDPSQANRLNWHYQEIMRAPVGQVLAIRDAPIAVKPASERFGGRLYVLIDRQTYSAAVMFAATVKDHRLGTIVGEETGGLATQFADLYPFELPNTGLRVRVSHKLIVRPNGSHDRRGVIPDHAAPQGEAILQRALTLIRQARSGRPRAG